MTAVLLRPISKEEFNARLRELGHQIPADEPDVYDIFCEELVKPLPGEDQAQDPEFRISSTLNARPKNWFGARNRSGQPIVTDKAFGEWRHHYRKHSR